MPHITQEIHKSLSALLGRLQNAKRRADDVASKVSKLELEVQYKELCQGFGRGQEPAEPQLLIEARLDLVIAKRKVTELEAEVDALENKALKSSSIRVLSDGKNGAMVIITAHDELTGKKTSLTRHLRKSGNHYTGKSLFGHRFISYDLYGTEKKAV